LTHPFHGSLPIARLGHQAGLLGLVLMAGAGQAGTLDVPAEPGSQSPSFLVIRADRQTVEADRTVVVAEGNVEARFQGWSLFADRVEVMERTRTVYATGRLRLHKGDQVIQASRLRYSQLEGSGELADIYGVIDQEGLEREVKAIGFHRLPVGPDHQE
jgi:lipopolysaccharide assembly outer membrane protein LptD (OstA)